MAADNYEDIPGYPNWKWRWVHTYAPLGDFGFLGEGPETVENILGYYLKVLYTGVIPYRYDVVDDAGNKHYTDTPMSMAELDEEFDKWFGETRTIRKKVEGGLPWEPAGWTTEEVPTAKAKSMPEAIDMADAMQSLFTSWSKRSIINEHKKLHRVKRFYFTEPDDGPYTSLRLRVTSAGEHWAGSSVEDDLPGTMITLAGLNTDEEPYDA